VLHLVTLHRVSHCLPDIALYLSHYRFDMGYYCSLERCSTRGASLTKSFPEACMNVATSHILLKLDFLDYIYVVDSMGLSLTTLT